MTNSLRSLAIALVPVACSFALAFGTLNVVTHSAELIDDVTGAYCTTDADCARQGYRIDYATGYAVPLPAGCVSGYRGEPGEDATVVRCTDAQVTEGMVSADTWDCLIRRGYVGRPDDGLEALYPNSADLDTCTMATDA